MALTVQINGDLPEDVLDSLNGASLLVEQANNEDAASQDPYASATADYARLLAVLYEAGYFGAEISIKLDGREAANVSAINAPKTANSAVINIQPGPVFRYGTAQVKPIAPGTELPKGFATGETAVHDLPQDCSPPLLHHVKLHSINAEKAIFQIRANAMNHPATIRWKHDDGEWQAIPLGWEQTPVHRYIVYGSWGSALKKRRETLRIHMTLQVHLS